MARNEHYGKHIRVDPRSYTFLSMNLDLTLVYSQRDSRQNNVNNTMIKNQIMETGSIGRSAVEIDSPSSLFGRLVSRSVKCCCLDGRFLSCRLWRLAQSTLGRWFIAANVFANKNRNNNNNDDNSGCISATIY